MHTKKSLHTYLIWIKLTGVLLQNLELFLHQNPSGSGDAEYLNVKNWVVFKVDTTTTGLSFMLVLSRSVSSKLTKVF